MKQREKEMITKRHSHKRTWPLSENEVQVQEEKNTSIKHKNTFIKTQK